MLVGVATHYLPFKVILVAGAPGEVDLSNVARSVETASVRSSPLKHDSSTKHTVNRQMLGGEEAEREQSVRNGSRGRE